MTEKIMETAKEIESSHSIHSATAVLASVCFGTGCIIRKKALLRLYTDETAGAPDRFRHLKDNSWFMGVWLMIMGVLIHLLAYGFAPASIVTPLGGLSIPIFYILSIKYLSGNMNVMRLMGCFLCIMGYSVMILYAPDKEEITSLGQLSKMMETTGFIIYLGVVTFICLIIFCHLGPKYGNNHILVYTTLCSCVSSVTVMACSGLALAIKFGIDSQDVSFGLFTAFLSIIVVLSISLNMIYFKKAVDIFSTSVVAPIYYVLFSSLVLVGPSVLLEEWNSLSVRDIFSYLCGFLMTSMAFFMMSHFKDLEPSTFQANTNDNEV